MSEYGDYLVDEITNPRVGKDDLLRIIVEASEHLRSLLEAEEDAR